MERIVRATMAFCIVSIMALVSIQVILRYVFEYPVILVEELLIFPTVWMYFLGSAMASKDKTQINASLAVLVIKDKKKLTVINAIAMLISTLISFWLLTWAFEYLQYSYKVWKTTSYAFIPLFFVESATFFGFTLITFYTAADCFAHVKEFFTLSKK